MCNVAFMRKAVFMRNAVFIHNAVIIHTPHSFHAQRSNQVQCSILVAVGDITEVFFLFPWFPLEFATPLLLKTVWSGGSPGNYRISNHASNSTLRMRDVLKDPSILQSCVLGPRNFIQLLWSFLGSLFIL
jgi:hypothetical protein